MKGMCDNEQERRKTCKNYKRSRNFKHQNSPIPSFTNKLLFGRYEREIIDIYKKLGGIEEEYNYRGKWDIVTDECIIEPDEQLHFNNYRFITLSSPLYDKINAFPVETYRNYCKRYKDKCLSAGSYGGKWTNSSCEKMFGPAQKNGDLTGNGSPRWKQRAFYDFVKDMSYLVTSIPVVRISVYDTISYHDREKSLGDLLENNYIINSETVMGIQEIINRRLVCD